VLEELTLDVPSVKALGEKLPTGTTPPEETEKA
jgi:hypothetical protein